MPPSAAVCLAMLAPGQIVENGLLDSARPLPPAERQKYLALWERLRTENAPFRVLGEEGLQSAPISFFDRPLLSRVTADWQKIARVVGHVLADSADDARFQTGDLVLLSRMWALIDAGLLESRGDVSNMRSGEVRLPNVRSPDNSA
jgi:hypothetical protein